MSSKEQAVILQYLMELTGLSEQVVNGEAGEPLNNDAEDFTISGPGAFVIEPGQGSTNENGHYVCDSYSRSAYQRRNEWMIDRSSLLIAAYTGVSGGTRNTIEYAKRQGGCDIQYLTLTT